MMILFKRCIFFVVIFISFQGFAGTPEGTDEIVKKDYIVHFVDNTNSRIVIDDYEYAMRIGMTVRKDRRESNRYALKVGQKVLFKSSVDGKKRYIESITILPK